MHHYPPPGWYRHGALLRWWDGARWTAFVAPVPPDQDESHRPSRPSAGSSGLSQPPSVNLASAKRGDAVRAGRKEIKQLRSQRKPTASIVGGFKESVHAWESVIGNTKTGEIFSLEGVSAGFKQSTYDIRVVVDGPTFQWIVDTLTLQEGAVKKFVTTVNGNARRLNVEHSGQPTLDSQIADHLERLTSLHRAGAISHEEFARAKSAMLRQRE